MDACILLMDQVTSTGGVSRQNLGGKSTGAARNASFTMAISMCLGRVVGVVVSFWVAGRSLVFFFRDPFHVILQHRFFAAKKFSKNHGMLIFTQQLGTWSWNTTWEIRFFSGLCETRQEILEYASGGRQGNHGISRGSVTWAPMAYAVA